MLRPAALISFLVGVSAALLVAVGWTSGRAAPGGIRSLADSSPGTIAVDVELVLAVDISYSMDPDEQALQREGYLGALVSKEFLDALKHGMHGKVAVTYVEWAGSTDQRIVMPWRLIDGAATAAA